MSRLYQKKLTYAILLCGRKLEWINCFLQILFCKALKGIRSAGRERHEVISVSSNQLLREIVEWAGVIIAALVFSLFINFCIIVNATVPTSSMETTIMTGDRVVGLRLSYSFSEPERGDIIIFKYPDDEKVLYIKRIIGMPGETVEVHDGGVYIDGKLLDEPYLTVVTEGDFGPYVVPEGHYFMMGDNRNCSLDSRYWKNTFLSRDKIVGKAIFRYFPSFQIIDK